MLFARKKPQELVMLPNWEIPDHFYTPDRARLAEYEWQNYFAYGEDMQGEWRHDLLSDSSCERSEICTPGYTQLQFSVWVKDLGDYSYPVALGHNFPSTYPANPLLHIKGQLLRIRPRRFDELDKLRLNGYSYTRVRTNIYIPYKRIRWTKRQGTLPPIHQAKTVRAWMYIGIPDYWDELICAQDFKPADQFYPKNPRLPNHYFFMNEEEKKRLKRL